jgi:hypothetical protein
MALPPIAFRPAVGKDRFVRAAISGVSGSGKTHTALLAAKALSKVGILVIDSENGNSSIYAAAVPHDVYTLETHSPAMYMATLQAAAGKYDVVVIDSMTHEWNGKGGVLEIVDQIGKFKGWIEATPMHNRFLDAITRYPGHVVATVRCKMDISVEDKDGKKVITKLGTGLVQRDGIENEFDVVLMMADDETATPFKKYRSTMPARTWPMPRTEVPQFLADLASSYRVPT